MIRVAIALILASVGAHCAIAQDDARQGSSIHERGKYASDVDRQVLEALLVNISSDTAFPAPASSDKSLIVLHERTPKFIEPIINTSLVMSDTGGKVLPKDAWDDLVRRNAVRRDKNSREIFYDGLAFDDHIVVGNAFPGPQPPFQGKAFDEVFPHARGWVEAWVPGYSKDGNMAIVKARVGPTEKWTTITAILAKQNGKWIVSWRRYSAVI